MPSPWSLACHFVKTEDFSSERNFSRWSRWGSILSFHSQMFMWQLQYRATESLGEMTTAIRYVACGLHKCSHTSKCTRSWRQRMYTHINIETVVKFEQDVCPGCFSLEKHSTLLRLLCAKIKAWFVFAFFSHNKKSLINSSHFSGVPFFSGYCEKDVRKVWEKAYLHSWTPDGADFWMCKILSLSPVIVLMFSCFYLFVPSLNILAQEEPWLVHYRFLEFPYHRCTGCLIT